MIYGTKRGRNIGVGGDLLLTFEVTFAPGEGQIRWAPMFEIAQYLLFGLLVGAYGTMVGVGGGFLIVPFLLVVHHVSPEKAAGTSIAVVFLNALSGTLAYVRQKRIDYKAGVLFAAATIPGAIAGAFLSRFLTGRLFDVVFATFLCCMASYLLWRPLGARPDVADIGRKPNYVAGMIISLFVGVLSSVLGIGGGIIHVPALIHFLGFTPHMAVATSSFILVTSALTGAITHYRLGHVMFEPALYLGIGVIVGAQLGARFGQKIKGPMLVRMLSIALFVVALRLFLR